MKFQQHWQRSPFIILFNNSFTLFISNERRKFLCLRFNIKHNMLWAFLSSYFLKNKKKESMTSHTTFLNASNNNFWTTLGSLFSMTLCIVNGFSAFSLNFKLMIITICKASLKNECFQLINNDNKRRHIIIISEVCQVRRNGTQPTTLIVVCLL